MFKDFDDGVRKFTAKWGVHRGLVDFSAVNDASAVSSAFITNRSQHRLVPNTQFVLVASDPTIFGLCRMYASYQRATIGDDETVVATMKEAYKALSLPLTTQWDEVEY